MKTCNLCKFHLTQEAFSNLKGNKDGKWNTCKLCVNTRRSALRPACLPCNVGRQNKTPREWAEYKAFKARVLGGAK